MQNAEWAAALSWGDDPAFLILHSFQMREPHADGLPVPPEAIGASGHANIVEFVRRWMQPEPRT